MRSRSAAALYFLLAVMAAISMVYYVAGVVALREEFFHSSRYAREPFDFGDDGLTLKEIRREAVSAGLANGDALVAINGEPFQGYAQFHDLVQGSDPGRVIGVAVRTVAGTTRTVQIPLAAREGPNFSLGGYLTFLLPVLAVPLLGLVIGYWVVASRPRDLNAWLVLLLLAFPETAYGNLDWSFWPRPWYLWLGVWNLVVQFFAFPALLWFGFLFPERWRVDRRLPWLKYAVLAASCCTLVLGLRIAAGRFFAVQATQSLNPVEIWNDRVSSWIEVLCVLLFLVALFDKLRSVSTADARRRLRVLAIGSGLSLGPLLIIFVVVPWFGMDPHHGKWFGFIVPIVAIFPLTLAYVLIVQRAMDVRVLLRMGTKYLLARATIMAIEVAIVGFVLLRFVVPMMDRRDHRVLTFVLLAVCIGALFQIFILRGSLSQRLQRWLDRKFFREAYNSEAVLSQLSDEVRQLTDRGALVDIVLRRVSEVLHVPRIAILLRGGQVFHLQQALGMEFAGNVFFPEESATVQNLLRTNQPATVYRDRPEEWFIEADATEQALLREIQAELLLPMAGRSRLIGMMALGPKRSEEPYTPTDLRTLQRLAAQTGLTLEVTELVRALADESAKRERMNREIEIAREVQQRFFPQRLPETAGVSLAGMCRPASEVGGDYYDLIELGDGRLGFAIGDVSGKGISAALVMASLRASLRGLILDDPGDLGKMMQKVNRLVYEASSSSRYATFFFATYDPASRELRYVNAGHNPPMLARAGTGAVERLEATGPVVGLLAAVAYETHALVLEAGDLLIAYTDGISEAMTAEDEEWGEERMLEAVPRGGGASAIEILEELFRAADGFAAGAEQHDDMTLLVMKLV